MPPVAPLDLASLPAEPGVYRFWDAQGRVLYIGRAIDLRRRVRSYWGSLKGRPRMRRMVPQIVRVDVAVCASEHEAAWLERNLLEQRKPRWNRARGGLEVPVYLRLDASPRTPSLSVTHAASAEDAAACFGPYLGGTRVRTAVTALGTIYPLAYTGEALGGAERSMAQARGVIAADRERLAASIGLLLARDPATIAEACGQLQARRGRAAAELEFELAGRLQEQLEALEWLVSPQRVTVDGAGDATACGWADGVLVEFGIKAGRVRTWTQRECTEDEASPLIAATAPSHADFAHRAATTASHLRMLHLR
ncbi:MAG: GIY-YIG nuclease family protein [Solirubrobacteraceae bacterium]|nr:GIY-YIG nuclease family protein [Solirubrobacteraceae bacterium]